MYLDKFSFLALIPTLNVLSKDSNHYFRQVLGQELCKAIIYVDRESVLALMPTLMALSKDSKLEVRQALSQGLCETIEYLNNDTAKALMPIFKLLLEDNNKKVRQFACDAISYLWPVKNVIKEISNVSSTRPMLFAFSQKALKLPTHTCEVDELQMNLKRLSIR